jgi:DNA-binding NarL/FixJ family response regulator
MKILNTYLVEDSPVIRASLITALEELSPVKVVASAESEAQASAWLLDASHRVDLVIIDVFLKSGSGLGVLKSTHEAAAASGCQLVVLTNYATLDIRRKCLALGAARVFDKSHDIDALITYCNKLAAEEPDITAPGLLV